jgi:glutamyl-tRNA synthetase
LAISYRLDDNPDTKFLDHLMGCDGAVVCSKTIDVIGVMTAIEMDLRLEGDFRKAKKRITRLVRPMAEHPLAGVALLYYGYLVAEKELEDGDDSKDFLPPVTEFGSKVYANGTPRNSRREISNWRGRGIACSIVRPGRATH